MRKILVPILFVLGLAPAHAIERYNSDRMACDEVRAAIRQDGAAIVRYRSNVNPGLQLYNRYVRNGRYCQSGERVRTSYIRAADTRHCPVYECERIDFGDRDRRIIPD